MKEPHINISKDIVQSIASLWADHELEDFTVEVEGVTIRCHTFILASCSGFFRALLRSGMKECQEKLVHLKNISLETFELILETLYTGSDVLTLENVSDVWHASDQLQILFLAEHCEKFVGDNVSLASFEFIYHCAQLIKSKTVLENFVCLILNNFASIAKTDAFLELDYNLLHDIVEDRRLKVDSEDVVLYSIYKWVKHGQSALSREDQNSLDVLTSLNNRRKYLPHLLSASRLCLATSSCLVDIYENEMTHSEPKARKKIFKAITFQMPNYLHGIWRKGAQHRDCSNLDHVGVICNAHSFYAISLRHQNILYIPERSYQTDYCKLVVHNQELYSCDRNKDRPDCVISVLKDDTWIDLVNISGENHFMLAHDKFIYVFNTDEGEISWFNPTERLTRFEKLNAQLRSTTFALSYQAKILIFSSVSKNNVEQTLVYCWDTANDTWSRLENFNGSAKNMTSFRDSRNVFILESNGNLWKLYTLGDVIGFTFLKKLWELDEELRGAFLYNKKLFIFGKTKEINLKSNLLENVFDSTSYWHQNANNSNFVYFVYPKKYFIEKKTN